MHRRIVTLAALLVVSPSAARADTAALWAQVDVLTRAGRDAEAVPLLDAILRAAPDDGAAYAARGRARWRALDDASHQDGLGWIQGQICREKGADCPEVAGALDDLGRAAALTTGAARAAALSARADIRSALKAPASAMADEDAAVAAVPDDPNLRTRRALLRAELGDAAGAREDLDRAVALRPDDTATLRYRSALRADAGDAAGALGDLDAAVRLSPGDGEVLVERAELRRNLHDLAGARADLDAALALAPSGAAPPEPDPENWVSRAWELRRAVAEPGERAAMGPILDGLKVERVEKIQGTDGRPALSVTLDAGSARRFGDWSAAHVGSPADLVLDGRTILSPRILMPIRGGVVIVSGNFAPAALSALADGLRRPDAALSIRTAD